MLLTTCSNCGAQFKVLPEHLNVRQGRVMCGRCRHVFNAFESLKRVEDDPPVFAATVPMSTIAAASAGAAASATSPLASLAEPESEPSIEMERSLSRTGMYPRLPESMLTATQPLPPAPRNESPSDAAPTPRTAPPVPSARSSIDELEVEFFSEPEFASTVPTSVPESVDDTLPPVFRAHEPGLPQELDETLKSLAPIRATEPLPSAPTPPPAAFSATSLSSTSDSLTQDASASRANETPRESARATIEALGPMVDELTRTAPLATVEAATETAVAFADMRVNTSSVPPLSPSLAPASAKPAFEITDPLPVSITPAGRVGAQPAQGKWIALALAAALLLGVMIAFNWRNALVQSYPQLRPAFASVCATVGCKLAWGRDISAISVASAELVEAPGKPGKLIASAVLRNSAATKQDLPSVELRLTNNTNQVVISRILDPADYLGRAPTAEDGIAALGDLSINLNIEIPPTTAASGYEFLPFFR
jgi:predicted Zn finger-like uncharacterized protein